MKNILGAIPKNDYTTKLSVSVCYAILASIALNFFWQPGHIYSSGLTGLAQILSTLISKTSIFTVPVSAILFVLNVPMFCLAWKKISKKFTVFTIISVTLASIFMQIVPETVLTPDPIICAIFGGAINGLGTGFALRSGISSGGLDIISITIRRATGKSIGSIAILFNAFIIFAAALLFGWKYAFYSALSIFISGKVTDVVYTKQQKMQVMIITKKPEEVVSCVQDRLRRGITIIHGAEGAFSHDGQTVLLTVITRYEMHDLEDAMKVSDKEAFVSISDNVKILGNFYDPGM